MISKSFFESLELIVNERNLEMADVLEKVKIALSKACALEGFTGEIETDFNFDRKKIRVFDLKTVVEEVDPEGPRGQLTLEEAKKIKERVKVGSVIKTEINLDNDIGRKGATQFKQILIQGIKELGRKRAYEFFKERENEMISVTVLDVTESYIVLDLGLSVITHMPIGESLPGEVLYPSDVIKVYITKIEETNRDPKVFVSRAHRDIIKRLFETYIPEIANGSIEIMAVARDPGQRSKVGVKSNNEQVDPKGACVGVRGERVKQINQALNGERIDIFVWNDDPVQLIAEALTPADVLSVLINEADKMATVIVQDDQFSLAIGKGGQNARLASQATGWKIDIKDESYAFEEGIKFKYNVEKNK